MRLALHWLRPYRAAFLSIPLEHFLVVPHMQIIEILMCQYIFPVACYAARQSFDTSKASAGRLSRTIRSAEGAAS